MSLDYDDLNSAASTPTNIGILKYEIESPMNLIKILTTYNNEIIISNEKYLRF